MTLDLSSFQRAITQLEDALALCGSEGVQNDPRLMLHLRAAAIQAFEFTYELAFKMLKRYLGTIEPNPALSGEMTFNELIRRGYALGLLKSELIYWKGFRQDRGTTSHTYDETKAQGIFEDLPAFLEEAKFLLSQIHKRQGTGS